MKKNLKEFAKQWSPFLLFILLILNAIQIKLVISNGVSSGTIMILRGLGCSLFVAILAYQTKVFPKINSLKIQGIRVILAGLSIACTTSAYAFASPATVTQMSRIDLPFLALITSLTEGTASFRKLVWSLLTLTWFIIGGLSLRQHNELLTGYILAAAGGLTLAFGFIFVNKSAKTEHPLITTLTPAIASILFGAILNFSYSPNTQFPNFSSSIILASTLGLNMFLIYQVMSYRHKNNSPVLAELPGVIVPIFILGYDYIVQSSHLNSSYISIVVGGVFLMLIVAFISKSETKSKGVAK